MRIASEPEDIHAVRIAAGEADLVLGCDMVVAASAEALAKMQRRAARARSSTATRRRPATSPRNRDLQFPARPHARPIAEAAGARATSDFVDATRLATALLGDAIATNLFMLGYAWQQGLVPVSRRGARARDRAQRRRGRGEQARVRLGPPRRARSAQRVEAAATRPQAIPTAQRLSQTLDEIVARRVEFLTDYQDARLRRRATSALVERVRERRSATRGRHARARRGGRALLLQAAWPTRTSTRSRACTPTAVPAARSQAQFEGDYKLNFHLAPPLLAKRDPATGDRARSAFGAVDAAGVPRAGEAEGPARHGASTSSAGRAERQHGAPADRRLRDGRSTSCSRGLDRDNHALRSRSRSIPDQIRGYGHVKDAT